jgi:hypothetical protein
MNKLMKGFLWSGTEVVQKGKSLVAWSKVQGPLVLGGLGVLDLQVMALAAVRGSVPQHPVRKDFYFKG